MAESQCACAVVTRQALREHIRTEPEFAFELVARVIKRARLATQTARSMALLDVYGRLTQLIESMAEPSPDGMKVIREPASHAELAARLGCSREMVSRLLADLRQGGYLALGPHKAWLVSQRLPTRW
jgi:CRP/FNR family cyclic AMP-dependent transcriptional regulator